MDRTRRRVQLDICGRRGCKDDPLYRCRRTLLTGQDLLTDAGRERLEALFADDRHGEVEQAWTVYQTMIAAYRHPDPATGRRLLSTLIDTAARGILDPLVEIRTLARILKRRAVDLLASFDRPRTSNGLTEAINGRLEHLRGSALGLRNLTHYIAGCLLEAGGFRPNYTPHCEEPVFASQWCCPQALTDGLVVCRRYR